MGLFKPGKKVETAIFDPSLSTLTISKMSMNDRIIRDTMGDNAYIETVPKYLEIKDGRKKKRCLLLDEVTGSSADIVRQKIPVKRSKIIDGALTEVETVISAFELNWSPYIQARIVDSKLHEKAWGSDANMRSLILGIIVGAASMLFVLMLL